MELFKWSVRWRSNYGTHMRTVVAESSEAAQAILTKQEFCSAPAVLGIIKLDKVEN